MAVCGKCGTEMERREDWWHCPKCGFGREVAKKLPTYEELLEENKRLKEQIKKLS